MPDMDQKVIIEIESGLLRGEMSERTLRLIFEWKDLHKEELKQTWGKTKNGEQPDKIEPLK